MEVKFNPNDHGTQSTWFVTYNHPGRPEHGKRHIVITMKILDSHARAVDGIQVWGFAGETGDWLDATYPFDTGWGDKLEQEIVE